MADKPAQKLSGPALLLKSLGIDVAAIEQQAMSLVNGLVAMQAQLDRIETAQNVILGALKLPYNEVFGIEKRENADRTDASTA